MLFRSQIEKMFMNVHFNKHLRRFRFGRKGNWNLERWIGLPKTIQLLCGKAQNSSKVSWLLVQHSVHKSSGLLGGEGSGEASSSLVFYHKAATILLFSKTLDRLTHSAPRHTTWPASPASQLFPMLHLLPQAPGKNLGVIADTFLSLIPYVIFRKSC